VSPPTRFSLIPKTSAIPSRAMRAASCSVTRLSSTDTGAACLPAMAAMSSSVSQGCSKVALRLSQARMT
jgi:hypothetical protein